MTDSEDQIESKEGGLPLAERLAEKGRLLLERVANTINVIKSDYTGVSDADKEMIAKANKEGRNWGVFGVPPLESFDNHYAHFTNQEVDYFSTPVQSREAARSYMNFTDLPINDTETVKWINTLVFLPLDINGSDKPGHNDGTSYVGYEKVTNQQGEDEMIPVAYIEPMEGGLTKKPLLFLDLKHKHHFVLGSGNAAKDLSSDLSVKLPKFDINPQGISYNKEATVEHNFASQYLPDNHSKYKYLLPRATIHENKNETLEALNNLSWVIFPENYVQSVLEMYLYLTTYDSSDYSLSGESEVWRNRGVLRSNEPITLAHEESPDVDAPEGHLAGIVNKVDALLGISKGYEFLCYAWDAIHPQLRWIADENGNRKLEFGIQRYKKFNWEY